MLHTIPLTVVESRKEVDEVKELLSICKEYHIALRCELRRKELKEDQVRGARGWEGEGQGWAADKGLHVRGTTRLGYRAREGTKGLSTLLGTCSRCNRWEVASVRWLTAHCLETLSHSPCRCPWP